jgi:hypothetical protein
VIAAPKGLDDRGPQRFEIAPRAQPIERAAHRNSSSVFEIS